MEVDSRYYPEEEEPSTLAKIGSALWSAVKWVAIVAAVAALVITGLALFNKDVFNWVDGLTRDHQKDKDGNVLKDRHGKPVAAQEPGWASQAVNWLQKKTGLEVTPVKPPEPEADSVDKAIGAVQNAAGSVAGTAGAIYTGVAGATFLGNLANKIRHPINGKLFGPEAKYGRASTAPFRLAKNLAGGTAGTVAAFRDGMPEETHIPSHHDVVDGKPKGAKWKGVEAYKEGVGFRHFDNIMAAKNAKDGPFIPTHDVYETGKGSKARRNYVELEPGTFDKARNATQEFVADKAGAIQERFDRVTGALFRRNTAANEPIAREYVDDYLKWAKEEAKAGRPVAAAEAMMADSSLKKIVIEQSAAKIEEHLSNGGTLADLDKATVSNVASQTVQNANAQKAAVAAAAPAVTDDGTNPPPAGEEAGGGSPSKPSPSGNSRSDRAGTQTEAARPTEDTAVGLLDAPLEAGNRMGNFFDAKMPDGRVVIRQITADDGTQQLAVHLFDGKGNAIAPSKASPQLLKAAKNLAYKVHASAPAEVSENIPHGGPTGRAPSIKAGAMSGATAAVSSALVIFNPDSSNFEKWTAGSSGLLGISATVAEFTPQMSAALTAAAKEAPAFSKFAEAFSKAAPGLSKVAAPLGAVAGTIAAPLSGYAAYQQFSQGEYVEGAFSTANTIVGGTGAVAAGASAIGATATAAALAPVAVVGGIAVGTAYIGYGTVKGAAMTAETAGLYSDIDASYQPDMSKHGNAATAMGLLTRDKARAVKPVKLNEDGTLAADSGFGAVLDKNGKFNLVDDRNGKALELAIQKEIQNKQAFLANEENVPSWGTRYLQFTDSQANRRIAYEQAQLEVTKMQSALAELPGHLDERRAYAAATLDKLNTIKVADASMAEPSIGDLSSPTTPAKTDLANAKNPGGQPMGDFAKPSGSTSLTS